MQTCDAVFFYDVERWRGYLYKQVPMCGNHGMSHWQIAGLYYQAGWFDRSARSITVPHATCFNMSLMDNYIIDGRERLDTSKWSVDFHMFTRVVLPIRILQLKQFPLSAICAHRLSPINLPVTVRVGWPEFIWWGRAQVVLSDRLSPH